MTQLAPAATQGEVYALALLALPPQAAAVEWPPGLGIALLDRGQPPKVRKPCAAVCSQDALIFEAIARETVNRLSTAPIDSTKEKSLLPL